MAPKLQLIFSLAIWVAAFALGILPLVLGFDFGGVLWWTQSFAALVVIISAVLATGSLATGPVRRNRDQIVLIPLGLWFGFSLLHCLTMDHSIVGLLSPGTATAFQEWLPDLVPDADVESMPMSVSIDYTRHACAFFSIVVLLAWSSGRVFAGESHAGFLLHAICICTALQACYALVCLVEPSWSIRPPTDATVDGGFGSFINRNNIALFFNFGIGCSLGLMTWRLANLMGLQVDEEDFEWSELLVLANDPRSIFAMACLAICCAGVLACGSRGGLMSSFAGGAVAFGIMKGQHTVIRWLGVCIAGFLVAVLLLSPGGGRGSATVDRLDEIDLSTGQGILDNTRWGHWQNSFQTGLAHLPAGSGLATYAYAYLPYQDEGHGAWFHHADNLWLEAFVEQGVPGGLAILSILWIVLASLSRLGSAGEPIDQGLRTAGYFSLGAILCSQIFDFGLVIPANLTIATMLFSAICVRSEIVRNQELEHTLASAPNLDEPKSVRSRWTTVLVAALFIATGLFGYSVLRADAADDTIIRQAWFDLKHSKSEYSLLDRNRQRLNDRVEQRPSYGLLEALGETERHLAKQVFVTQKLAEGQYPLEEIYERTRNSVLRSDVRDPSSGALKVTDDSLAVYRSALVHEEQSLKRLPLASQPRLSIVYLDFVHRDTELTRVALVQLSDLYKRSPQQLMDLAKLAADGEDFDLAGQFWRRATWLDPRLARFVVDFVKEYPTVSLLDCVDDGAEAQRTVSAVLVRSVGNESDLNPRASEFLSAAVSKIDCRDCDTLGEQADCFELAGDIHSFLRDDSASLSQYETAVQMDPTNITLRVKWITRLEEAGLNRRALLEARRARQTMEQGGIFDRLIKAMASRQVMEATESSEESD